MRYYKENITGLGGSDSQPASSGQALPLSVPRLAPRRMRGMEPMPCLLCSFMGCISQGWMRQRESGDPEESEHLGGCSGPPSSPDLGPGPEGPPDTSILGPDSWGTLSRRDQSLYLHQDVLVSLPDFLYFTNTSIALTAYWCCSKHSADMNANPPNDP